MAPSVRLRVFLILSCFGYAQAARPRDSEARAVRFPVLLRGVQFNQTNATSIPPYIAADCNFEAELFDSIEANCKPWIEPFQTSSAFVLPWQRWEAAEMFVNCSYHQLFTRYPKAPSGASTAFRENGQISFALRPNAEYGRLFPPQPPTQPIYSSPGGGLPDFLPIFRSAILGSAQYISNNVHCDLLGPPPSNSTSYANSSRNSAPDAAYVSPSWTGQEFESLDPASKGVMQKLYAAIEVSTHQYTRCALQSPGQVQNCTIETTKKLGTIPPSLFVYSGADVCESKVWTCISIAFSIIIDLAFVAFQLWLQRHSVFSWLMFLVQVVSGVGMPLLEGVILSRQAYALDQQLSIVALVLLQPTANALAAVLYAIYLSKGLAFQLLAVDAVTTVAGLLLIMAVTLTQILAVGAQNYVEGATATVSLGVVPIGALLAVGPWALVYLVVGVFGLGAQLFAILGMLEFWVKRTAYCWAIALVFLYYGIGLVSFVLLTPVWALWELCWKVWQWYKKKKVMAAALVHVAGRAPDEKGEPRATVIWEKPVFPLVRWLRRKIIEGHWLWRYFFKHVFVLFVLTGVASLAGRCMLLTIIFKAGDAYCPSDWKPAVLSGLGLKSLALGSGAILSYIGVI